MKCWILAAIGLGLSFCRPTLAETTLLFRPEPTVWHQTVGQAIAGSPQLRHIRSTEVGQLSASERRTAQPERSYQAMFVPNDPQYALQWYLPSTTIPTAWDTDTHPPLYGGDPSIMIALLDTGITSTLVGSSVSMTDFSDTSIWTNPNEIAGDGIDNDGNGYIDDIHGWNFVANTNQPADDHKHGTHLASIIAATMNNSSGTAGIASNVTIMPLKVLNSAGTGVTSKLTAAIAYAVAQGADVINLSLGGIDDDPIFHQAIQSAVQAGVVVVAATGNEGASTVSYPARYSEVMSVGAIQRDGNRSAYSNYGADLDVVAPGGSTDPSVDGIIAETCTTSACSATALYYISGTSQAAAQVSASVGLLRSCGAVASSIAGLLTSTAHDLGAIGRDDVFGAGEIDVNAAIVAAGCTSTTTPAPTGLAIRSNPSSTTPLIHGRAYSFTKPVFTWVLPAGTTSSIVVTKNGATFANIQQTSTTYQPTLTVEGNYVLTVSAVDALGRTSTGISATYRYQRPTAIVSGPNGIQFLSSALAVTKTIPNASPQASGGSMIDGQGNRLVFSVTKKGSTLSIADTSGKVQSSWKPFGATFSGDIVAGIQRLSDGTAYIVTGTATGGSSLAWFTSTGTLLGRATVIPNDMNGLSLAIGDLDGDGNDEVITGQQVGAQVLIYDSQRKRIGKLLPRGKTFRQGWIVAAGDVTGDGKDEIITTPNTLQSIPVVLVLHQSGAQLHKLNITGQPKNIGIRLAVNDMTGDGTADILTIPIRTNPTVQLWSGVGKLLKKSTLTSKPIRSLSLIR